ncbi:PspC domain-containing protein [Corynebacterium renale]|uniref:Phage shock protein C (PspC) family protein n=1 Tax=Corynebacterium renale TaxID=1724 RepID=A0A2A9DLW2_9CORY|nr:PspC domain-containing protein [Corynebacterium renale]PFG27165.1 phage shock protein C (PspC) family protein [Corynebacterium renale]SQI23925.1 Phage shock protein C [Corynebacterium renale]
MSSTNEVFSDMWKTRPHRVEGGTLAGVCQGIAIRYQVDVTLVRVVFALLTLAGGGGIALYLLAWGLMPKGTNTFGPLDAALNGNGKGHPEFNQQKRTGWVIFVLVVISLLGGVPASGGIAGGGMLVGLIVAGLALYGLHQRTPIAPFPQGPDQVEEPLLADGPTQQTPPSWDPLGAAPFAWDLPEPGEEPKQTNWVRRLILGIAAVFLAIIALFVGLFGFVVTTNNTDDAPTAATSQLQDSYSRTIGDFTLDLRGQHTLDEDRSITIESGIGDVTVIGPRTIPTTVVYQGGVGDYTGPTTLNDDASGPRLTITINSGIGDVRVIPADKADVDD